MTRKISDIAYEIRGDWVNVNYAAAPYLAAMFQLRTIDDEFYSDSAASVIRYFLANAGTWRGPKAREIKAELKAMTEGK